MRGGGGKGGREEQWEGREDLWRGVREEGNNGSE